MQLNAEGQYEPVPVDSPSATSGSLLGVCPFSNSGPDETQLAAGLFGDGATFHDQIGYHLRTCAGHVREPNFRDRGSSGGMGKWIGHELMRVGAVDAVVQIEAEPARPGGGILYRYRVARDLNAVREGSKSVYYPVELSEVMEIIRSTEGRYAIVGVPCFIKAIRRLCAADSVLDGRIRYLVGLVCGHLKSTRYAEMLAWQDGIEPGTLAGVDFRKKYPGTDAKQKGMEFTVVESGREVKSGSIVQDYFGTTYDLGFFKYDACDYCDDVLAETADIVVGDAWLPRYVRDGRGTNLLIIRNPELLGMIEDAEADGRLHLEPLDADEVARSQAGGLRHRRDGLRYRLHLKDRQGEWRPEKRVQAATDHLDDWERNKYLMRMAIASEGRRVYAEARMIGSYSHFERRMKRMIRDYQTGDVFHPAPIRMVRRTRRFVKRSLRWIRERVRPSGSPSE